MEQAKTAFDIAVEPAKTVADTVHSARAADYAIDAARSAAGDTRQPARAVGKAVESSRPAVGGVVETASADTGSGAHTAVAINSGSDPRTACSTVGLEHAVLAAAATVAMAPDEASVATATTHSEMPSVTAAAVA